MDNSERIEALKVLRKTRGIDMDAVSYQTALLTENEVIILMKLLNCRKNKLEDEVQFVWIRYRMFMELVGEASIDILFE